MTRIATDLKHWGHSEADFLLSHGPQCSDSMFSFLVLKNVKAGTVLNDDLAQLVPATDKEVKTLIVTQPARVTNGHKLIVRRHPQSVSFLPPALTLAPQSEFSSPTCFSNTPLLSRGLHPLTAYTVSSQRA